MPLIFIVVSFHFKNNSFAVKQRQRTGVEEWMRFHWNPFKHLIDHLKTEIVKKTEKDSSDFQDKDPCDPFFDSIWFETTMFRSIVIRQHNRNIFKDSESRTWQQWQYF